MDGEENVGNLGAKAMNERLAPDSNSDSQRYYDALAAEFRAQDSFWDNPYDREIWRLEHDLIHPFLNHPGALLDLGCGFYPHFDFTKERSVVAGDISLGSLRVARDFGDESRQVHLVQFDAHALPFASSSMAYAIAGGELLNHLSDYPRALGEIRRVLRPGGILLLQVGAKWCLDSLWAILDAFLGNSMGYSVTRKEAVAFIRLRRGDLPVTWAITPSGTFRVFLLSIRRLERILREARFHVRKTYGANAVSGLVPLPIQQETESRVVRWLVSKLILLDHFFGRLPPFRSFAGNVFFVCEATAGPT
jgi:SAM-dependent methyltransferase